MDTERPPPFDARAARFLYQSISWSERHGQRDVQEVGEGRPPKKAAPAADESTAGPAYLMLTDPDGNPILIDQHVPSPPNQKK